MTASQDSIIRAGVSPQCAPASRNRRAAPRSRSSHRQVEFVAQQGAGELAADVAESDEADVHANVLNVCLPRLGTEGMATPAVRFGVSNATLRGRAVLG